MSSTLTSTFRKQTRGPVDLVVKNAKLLLESGIIRGGIGVVDGKIVVIASDEHLPEAGTVIDAEGNIMMPGLIDAHAHIHDPTMQEHETFITGSKAAVAGGVTTFVDMPLMSQVDTVKVVEEKIAQGEEMSVADFTFYAGMMNSENYVAVPLLVEKGVAAFKAFTCEPYQTSNGVLLRCLSAISEYGGHLTVHAEDQGVLDEFSNEMADDWDAPISHSLARPNVAEQLAIQQSINIAKETGGHLHIAHVTTREGVGEVERGRLRGVMVTTEVCPHHLMFYRDEMNRLGTKSKMNPPLRAREDRAALWSALLRGAIDVVVSDHAPCPIEMKEEGADDIRNAWSGVDGIQIILRVLLSEGINKARLSYAKLLRVCSRNPARIFGLYPKKGVLAIGADADFVIIDPNKEEKITADLMESKCGWTLYEGITMKGTPVKTFIRGIEAYNEGNVTLKPGHGMFQAMGSGDRPIGD
ncbi:MAG: allantoinase AllB [Candidatus Thorarchaeota archaeon]